MHRLSLVFVSQTLVVADLSTALADVELTSDAGSADVRELEHRRELSVRPLWAQLTDRHRFRNSGTATVQLIYRFDMPGNAAVRGLEVRVGSKSLQAVAVDARAAIDPLPEATADGERSDLALLRQIGLGRYELTVYPVDPGLSVEATIRAVVPTTLADGRLSLALPARGVEHSANLAATAVATTTLPWRSVRKLDQVSLNGQRQRQLTIAAGDRAGLSVQARAVFARGLTALDLGVFGVELDKGLSGLAVAGIAPLGSRSSGRYFHAVIAIDLSSSMGRAGIAAALDVAESITAALPQETRIAVVGFDRRPRRRTGFLTNNHRVRGELAKLRSVTPVNGSNLSAALSAADNLIGSREARRLVEDADLAGSASAAVIVISDGATPLSTTATAIADRISKYTLGEAVFFSVAIARSGRSFPQPIAGAMSELVARTGGAAFAVAAAEAKKRGRVIARELGVADQLSGLRARLKAAGRNVAIDELALPHRLAPGSGFMAFAPWAGPLPKQLVVSASRRGKVVTRQVRRTRDPHAAGATAPLVLHRLDPDALAETHERAERRGGPSAPLSPERDAARQIATAGNRHAIASPFLSLVIPHPKDPFARERLAFARKWGSWLYRRAETPAELRDDIEYEPYHGSAVGPIGRIAAVTTGGRTRLAGSVEPAVMRREVRNQLYRRVRNCYEKELRAAPRLRGSLTLRFDIADGEVREATISAGSIGRSGLRRCTIDAAYSFRPPQAVGDHDTTYIVRYPFRFRIVNKRGQISEDDGSGKKIELDPNDPLDGID